MNPVLEKVFLQEDLNFLITNRIPRRYATLFMGWFSRIENPVVAKASIGAWRVFADDLRLHESPNTDYRSLHDCFVRSLKPGMRPVDPDPNVLTSPCDAEIGTFGRIDRRTLLQAKGLSYSLEELLVDPDAVLRYENGVYVTLRLKSNMYHRFHAPADARVQRVTYHSGDTWNVNPITLRRVEKLFCKNERAVIELDSNGADVALVAVASILVASMRLHCIDETLDLRYRGPNRLEPTNTDYRKGDELGYFQSGSTIIVCANRSFEFCPEVASGSTIRVGRPLLRRTGGTK